jgi:hypothetical protein
MQIKVPPGNNGDLQEAREQRLMAFATAGIERVFGSGGDIGATTILAVARCGESPVARAIVALRPVLAASGIKVRLVFSDEDATIDPFITGSADDAAAGIAEVRIVRDPRLRDAHEQLIVRGAAVWFGDSLRRDIFRRDLFEQYIADAPDAARAAAHAFEQLWARTEPCLALPALAADSLTGLQDRKPGNTGPTGSMLC